MKKHIFGLLFTGIVLLPHAHAQQAIDSYQEESPPTESGRCPGKWANPLTDICWSCVFPITIGGARFVSGQEDESADEDSGLLCTCPGKPLPRIGIKTSFWEPARRVDVTRKPYCLVSLGGMQIDGLGFRAPEGEVRRQSDQTMQSNYQVHWYVDPMFYTLEVLLDNPCLETKDFSLSFLTELSPFWNDHELTDKLNPEALLFGNPIAQAACAVDCIKTTISGFGSNLLFWCSGCNGPIYPLAGRVQAHVSHVQASSLLVHRIIAHMQRTLILWPRGGEKGLCGAYPQPVTDKKQYKYQMLYPIAQTQKINGRCCQPLGRSTAIWGAGKSFPYKGEDFSYLVFRKVNCCLGV